MTTTPDPNVAPEPDDARERAARVEAQVTATYDHLLALSQTFDVDGEQLRERAALGDRVLADDVAASAELSPRTWREAEDAVRAATTGPGGLLERSMDLDADALMVRATVMTYRWIDELREVAERTLGAIAGRAVGFLAPEVSLGGAIVSAGLIETDALDRDGLAAYLNELAAANPDLLEHFTSGGGGLLDRLRMRALLTVGRLGGADGDQIAASGLSRLDGAGVRGDEFAVDALAAVRDLAGGVVAGEADAATARALDGPPAADVEALMRTLAAAEAPLTLQRVGEGRYVGFLPEHRSRGAVRLVDDDPGPRADAVVAALAAEVEPGASVLLVGGGRGGRTAATVAARVAAAESAGRPAGFSIDRIVTVGAPTTDLALPDGVALLALEDRADPVALLSTLIAGSVAPAAPPSARRLTVVYDAGSSSGAEAWIAGGRAADTADHADLRAEVCSLAADGYLAAV